MENHFKELECDYLVVGSGVTGMAFADELIHGNQGKSHHGRQKSQARRTLGGCVSIR